MAEELFPNLYRIDIPLPNNPLRALNSYFLRGDERNLLIDTGFNQPECLAAMKEAMAEIGFSMANTDILVTHNHGDHSGLVYELLTPTSKVYSDYYTASALSSKETFEIWLTFDELTKQSGLPPFALDDHPGYKHASPTVDTVHVLRDGDVLNVGDYVLNCLETPGHAPSHLCLYEPNRNILFSGDHILGNITPNNTIWDLPWTVKRDLLGEYLDNLDRLLALDIRLTLPAHRSLITDTTTRINELKAHHEKRLQEIMVILESGKMNGAMVASQMKWRVHESNWDEFPAAQKIFACGEALSHLTHLVFQNKLQKELVDGVVYYSLLDDPKR